jgi:hypothetical protein
VEPREVLAELERLAARLGVAIRYEPFDAKARAKGGLCKLRGSPVVVIDDALPLLDKIGILSEALAMFDLAPIFVPPVLRARFDGAAPKAAGRRGPVRPPLRGVVKTKLVRR